MRHALFWSASSLLLAARLLAAPLDDSEGGGATCQYFASDAQLAWRHAGGDWIDAQSRPQGAAPFARVTLQPAAPQQQVVLDLGPLAQAWQSGDATPGAVMLRVPPAGGSGIVDFHSRESPPPGRAPLLVVTWDDGHTDRLPPLADTYLVCSTIRSLGRLTFVKVGADEIGLLVFPWTARPGRKVQEAALHLMTAKHYGAAVSVGIYAPYLPRAELAPEAGLADAEPLDAGLARSADVLYTENFDRGSRWRELVSDPQTEGSLSLVERDAVGAFQPLDGRALRVVLRRGSNVALNHQLRFAGLRGGEPEEAYFRYYLRLGANWDPVVDGGKMPGFAGTYGKAGWGGRPVDGYNGWSARGAFMQHNGPLAGTPRAIGTYAYTTSIDDTYGEVWGWNLGPTGRLQKNRWYAIEQYVKLNTPDKADGILRAWIDGELAFSKEDIRFRKTPALKVESVWLNVYHGGVSQADRDLTLYIDNLVIARRYIGPGRFPR